MFALTRKTDYAIIALSHIAQNPHDVCTAREIADRFHLPPSLLMNILKTLSQRGLVRSIRGAKGGYTLAAEPDLLTLADIIIAVEGPIRFVQCAGSQHPADVECDLVEICPVKRPVRIIHELLEEFLQRITLAEIVREAGETSVSVPLSVEGETIQTRSIAIVGSR